MNSSTNLLLYIATLYPQDSPFLAYFEDGGSKHLQNMPVDTTSCLSRRQSSSTNLLDPPLRHTKQLNAPIVLFSGKDLISLYFTSSYKTCILDLTEIFYPAWSFYDLLKIRLLWRVICENGIMVRLNFSTEADFKPWASLPGMFCRVHVQL